MIIMIISIIIMIGIITIIIRATRSSPPGRRWLLEGSGDAPVLRPVRLLRVWVSKGLTQADS